MEVCPFPLCCSKSMCSLSGCLVCLWLPHSHAHPTTHSFFPLCPWTPNHVKHSLQKMHTLWSLPSRCSASLLIFFQLSFYSFRHITHAHRHSTKARPWFGCSITTAQLQLSELCLQHLKRTHTVPLCQRWLRLLLPKCFQDTPNGTHTSLRPLYVSGERV